jgi:hypothetical protein
MQHQGAVGSVFMRILIFEECFPRNILQRFPVDDGHMKPDLIRM